MRNVAADNMRRRRSRLSSPALSLASRGAMLLPPWPSMSCDRGAEARRERMPAVHGLDALHFLPATAARVVIASTAWLRTLGDFNFTAALRVRAAIAFACLKRHNSHPLSS